MYLKVGFVPVADGCPVLCDAELYILQSHKKSWNKFRKKEYKNKNKYL